MGNAKFFAFSQLTLDPIALQDPNPKRQRSLGIAQNQRFGFQIAMLLLAR